jgi:threonine/homoserine/homoserine lactone efflux protein
VTALATVFATTFAVSLTGALSPGPVFALTAREAIRRGFWAGPAVAAGHGLLELLVVIALAAGLRSVVDDDAFVGPVALFGGLVLLWMGFELLRTAPGARLELSREAIDAITDSGEPRWSRALLAAVTGRNASVTFADPRSLVMTMAAAGVLVSLSNPYWTLWWASIGTDYLRRALDAGAAGVPVFYAAHVLSDILWLTFVAFVLASGRRLVSAGLYRGLLAVFGLLLLGLGVWSVSTGVGALM